MNSLLFSLKGIRRISLLLIAIPGILYAMPDLGDSRVVTVNAETTDVVKAKPLTTRDYVEQNLYLDFDVDSLVRANPLMTDEVTGVEGQFRALLYRVGRRTHLDSDSVRVVDIKSAEDINVSDRVYKWLVTHRDFSGNSVREKRKEWRAKGYRIISREINEAYFENLLDPTVDQLERIQSRK